MASSGVAAGSAFAQRIQSRPARSVTVHVVAAKNTPRQARKAKHMRLRSKINGTPERPRLCVFRSNHHMYAQVIDDVAGRTLASACTLTKEIREELDGSSAATKEGSELVGKHIAQACEKVGIDKVVFDRAGYPYHGRVRV